MQYFFAFQMDESLDISAVEESIHDATFNDQFECSDCDYKTRYKHNLRRHQQLKGHQQPQRINLLKSSTPLLVCSYCGERLPCISVSTMKYLRASWFNAINMVFLEFSKVITQYSLFSLYLQLSAPS